MPRFAVKYVVSPGVVQDSVIDADNQGAVAVRLRVREAQILVLREIRVIEASGGPTIGALRTGGRAISRHGSFPLRTFCLELAILLESGIALFEALKSLHEKERTGVVSQVLDDLTKLLAEGQTFANALAAQPKAFGVLFIATIEASQRTGQIPRALRRHAEYLAWQSALRDRLVSAAIYPLMLVFIGALVVMFLALFVLPRFAQIYADLGGELPWVSRVLLHLGQAISDNPLLAAAAAIVACAGLVSALRTQDFRAYGQTLLWRLPHLGERLRLLELAGLYRTLGLLLQAGVPVMPAMQASKGVIGVSLRANLMEATRRVREGSRLSDALEAQGLATPVSLRMIRVGEQTGELGSMLERASIFYDEELARFTEWIGKVVNPVLMLFMGLIVGGIVVLMYLPIFQVAERLQ